MSNAEVEAATPAVSIFKKIWDEIKKIPSLYYNWRKRNEELGEFLKSYKEQGEKLTHIDEKISNLSDDLDHIKEQVSDLEEQITQINGRVEAIGTGTKMELFDTLYTLYQTYVSKRGYATKTEKKEIEALYTIYHKHLNGNGLGTRYYEAIIALPESPEERDMKNNKGGNVA